MLRRLVPAFLLVSVAAAAAQPAVPAVPPLRSAPVAAPAARPAPAADPDAPPTSDGPATPVSAAQAAADAPPTSDAPGAAPTATPAVVPAQTASAAPTAPGAAPAAAPAQPEIPPLVAKDFPLTPEGNARFLATYAARPDVKRLDGGVLYRVLRAAEPKSNGPLVRGDTVTVSYRGWLIDGTNFDQTKPGIPVLFSLNGVIPGWRTALLKMKVGDLWEIAVPSDQAYGEEGRPGRIPPNQTLVFIVSLAKVEYAG